MAEFKRVSVQDVYQQWANGDVHIADIRDPQAFASGHIPGAYHLTDASLMPWLNSLDDDSAVVVVCYHGVSSQGAAQYLLNQGLEEVASMDGGFTAWAHTYPEAVERS